MKVGRTLVAFGLLTALYVGGLVYVDRQNNVFEHGVDLAAILPQMIVFTFMSFLLRYTRWRWLLGRRNFRIPWLQGLLGYLSGFALTASPGKLGELVRVRYFGSMGVPVDQVIACFFFERMLVLVVILLFSIELAGIAPGVAFAFAFVALVIIAVVFLSRSRTLWMSLAQWLQEAGWDSSSRLFRAFGKGIAGAMGFFRPLEFAVSIVIGLLAWGIQSLGCMYLLVKLGITVPPLAAFALYPSALLIGAASMVPGGIGTTEAAIVFLLHGYGAAFETSALAAIGMRLTTLWLAIALGLLAIPTLETLYRARPAPPDKT